MKANKIFIVSFLIFPSFSPFGFSWLFFFHFPTLRGSKKLGSKKEKESKPKGKIRFVVWKERQKDNVRPNRINHSFANIILFIRLAFDVSMSFHHKSLLVKNKRSGKEETTKWKRCQNKTWRIFHAKYIWILQVLDISISFVTSLVFPTALFLRTTISFSTNKEEKEINGCAKKSSGRENQRRKGNAITNKPFIRWHFLVFGFSLFALLRSYLVWWTGIWMWMYLSCPAEIRSERSEERQRPALAHNFQDSFGKLSTVSFFFFDRWR